MGTLALRAIQQRAGGPEPGWLAGVLALNPAVMLLDAVIPGGGVPLGSAVVPQALAGGSAYALLSLLLFGLAVVGLQRR